jgi:secreted trypsin-like serine protease
MKNLLLTLGIAIYFSLLSGCKHQQEKPVSQAKIIGGSDAKVVYPFMAQLFQQGAFNELAPFCGGAVIDKHLVLTAAHCVKQGRKPWVSTGALASMAIQDLFAEDGDPNRKIRQVVGSLIHEEYKEGSIANDIALLLLSDDGPQNFSADQYINLATAAPAPNEKLRIMGWGNQTSVGQLPAEQLQELDTLVLSQDLCKTKHQEGSILPGMLCLGNSSGGADACKGDSGVGARVAVNLTCQQSTRMSIITANGLRVLGSNWP